MIGIGTQFTLIARGASTSAALPLQGLLAGRLVRLLSSATTPPLTEIGKLGIELSKQSNECDDPRTEEEREKDFWDWANKGKDPNLTPQQRFEAAFNKNPKSIYFKKERERRAAVLQAERLQVISLALSSSDSKGSVNS